MAIADGGMIGKILLRLFFWIPRNRVIAGHSDHVAQRTWMTAFGFLHFGFYHGMHLDRFQIGKMRIWHKRT